MCATTHSYVFHDSFTSVSLQIHQSKSTWAVGIFSYVFTCVPWLIHIRSMTIHMCLYLLIHRSQSQNPDTQIPRYKFKSNQNLTLNFYDEIPRNLTYSISSCIFRILDFEDVAFSEEIVITHKKLLGISGCRTRPLQPSECRHRLTQMGENRKALWFGVGTNHKSLYARSKNRFQEAWAANDGYRQCDKVLSEASMCNATFTWRMSYSPHACQMTPCVTRRSRCVTRPFTPRRVWRDILFRVCRIDFMCVMTQLLSCDRFILRDRTHFICHRLVRDADSMMLRPIRKMHHITYWMYHIWNKSCHVQNESYHV